jgi:hypothetical protein
VFDSLDVVWYSTCHLLVAENRATMPVMAKLRENRERPAALVGFCLLVSLGLNLGCARSEPLHRSDVSSTSSGQNLPFHADTDQGFASDGTLPAAAPNPKQPASLPFQAGSHRRILPAGTLLTVQLENSLSTAKVRAGDVFRASVAAPLTIERDTFVERGTTITGRVESVRSLADHPGLVPGAGYFRLTLSSITVQGKQFALQTSSLFARGTVDPSEGIAVPKGRRLTFRLTAPVTFDEANSMTNRQLPESATE